jgi:hypothetical protein
MSLAFGKVVPVATFHGLWRTAEVRTSPASSLSNATSELSQADASVRPTAATVDAQFQKKERNNKQDSMGRVGCVDRKDRIVKSRPSRRILTLINGSVTGVCCPECVLRIPKWAVDVKGGCSGRLSTCHRRFEAPSQSQAARRRLDVRPVAAGAQKASEPRHGRCA